MSQLSLRKATHRDGSFLLHVRNAPDVRLHSKSQDLIDETKHRSWLTAELESSTAIIWIVEVGGQSAGYVRAQESDDHTWVLSVALLGPFRDHGYGKRAVRQACRLLGTKYGARHLVAEVLSTNTAACRFFESIGFVASESYRERGLALIRFICGADELVGITRQE